MIKRLSIVFSMVMIICLGCLAYAAEIHVAAAKGDVKKIEKLVKAKPVSLNLKDKDGATPLHHAAAKNQIAVTKLLIAKKAEINAKKNDGVTPLEVAAALGNKEIVKLLLDAKADISIVDKKGRTALSIAEGAGKTDIADMLRGKEMAMGVVTPAPVKINHPNIPGIPAPPAPPSSTTAKDETKDVKTLAEEFVDTIAAGNYAKATDYFDAAMKAAMTAQKLSETWRMAQSTAGKYKSRTAGKPEFVNGYEVVPVTCQFEKASFNAQVAFDAEKKITGFYIVDPQINK